MSLLLLSLVQASCEPPPVCYNTTQLVEAAGYCVTNHVATTKDGYGLSLQWVTACNRPDGESLGTVLLQHGFLDASHTWVMNEAENSLGFMLADKGYDVFLTNCRGNVYSTQVSPNAGTPTYWHFSYDEMIAQDVPALIDTVLALSGAESLTWVGHSQGTLMAFGALAQHQPDFVAKVNAVAALAPVAFLGNQGSLALSLLKDLPTSLVFDVMGTQGFPNQKQALVRWIEKLLPGLCEEITEVLCESVLFLVAGCNSRGSCDPGSWNTTRVPVYAGHVGGASVQDLLHFLQAAATLDAVPYYDYGTAAANQQHYNQSTPPTYDIGAIESTGVPIYLFAGGQDNFGDLTDVQKLAALLPSAELHVYPEFEHLDFIWGIGDGVMDMYATLMQVIATHT